MPPVVVARRNYFYPKWPLVFGRATGMENAMEVILFILLCVLSVYSSCTVCIVCTIYSVSTG